MQRKVVKFVMSMFLLAVLSMMPDGAHAQDNKPKCDIDVSEASALLNKAQAKASSGDTVAALDLLDQVKKNLEAIEDQCNLSLLDGSLSQTFSEAHGKFTINYPKGWMTQKLPGASTGGGDSDSILFANEAAAFNVLADSKPSDTAQGIVVYVGTAQQMIIQMGAFHKDFDYTTMNALNLLAAIVEGTSSSSAKIGKPAQGNPIGDFATAEADFSFNKAEKIIAEGSILIVQRTKDEYAVFVSFAPSGKAKTIATLARAMAATLKFGMQ